MYHTWLGVAAGIVSIGVVALIGLTIFNGQDLVMQRQNWELARILVPAMVSVLGWFITIWWAIRQIDISAEKNRKLQYEMIQSNEKIKIMDSVIKAFIDINRSLHKIQASVSNFKTNIISKREGKNNPDLGKLFEDSGSAYSEMFENVEVLKFNLARLSPYGIDLKKSIDFIVEVHTRFSNKSDWLAYQEESSKFFDDEDESWESMVGLLEKVSVNCDELCKLGIATVKLMTRPNNANQQEPEAETH